MPISQIDYTGVANNTITATQLANNTITSTQVANNTITATQLANNTITATQVANNTISPLQLSSTAQYTGFKNRIINGGMQIDQRNAGAAQTLTAGASAYTIDRWLGYCAGANVTGQQVSDGVGGYNYRYTGATSVTAINHIQRIESKNSFDLAGSTATLSLNLSNSLLTTVTWTAYYPTSTDNFSSLTQIATGSFTINSTLTKYSVNIAIPSAATTGIQITLAVGAQTSGTWVIGQVQFEVGSTATSFDLRDYGRELTMCQRYFEETKNSGSTEFQIQAITNGLTTTRFLVRKRTTPTMTVYSNVTGVSGTVNNGNGNVQTSVGGVTGFPDCFYVILSGTTSQMYTYNWSASAEL